jgi:hypothetical protein
LPKERLEKGVEKMDKMTKEDQGQKRERKKPGVKKLEKE